MSGMNSTEICSPPNLNMGSRIEDAGASNQRPDPILVPISAPLQPHSLRHSAGVRFAEPHSRPRSASRGRSLSRRSLSSNRKGGLQHSGPPSNKGKDVISDAGVAVMDAGPSNPAPPRSNSRRPPPARGNANSQKSWAAVAKSATRGYNLSYVPPVAVGNKMRVTVSPEILQASNPKWDECLVGYLIGKKLPFKLVEAALKHIWGPHLIEVMANDEGFFFLHIPDMEFRKEILDNGPLTIAKVPIILQQWFPLINLERKKHETVPIWIRLRNIPFSLWSPAGISVVASAVGKPLYVDSQTERMRMLSYARVCVEVQAGVGLPDVIEVDMLEDIRSVKVEYEWRPSYCPTCVAFGHRCQAETGQQHESPVLGTSPTRHHVHPSQLRKSTTAPTEEIWTEVSSRKRNPQKQQNVTAPPLPSSRDIEPPARIHSKLASGAPQPGPSIPGEEFEEQIEGKRQDSDVELPANSDHENPPFVASTFPSESELQEVQEPVPVCPESGATRHTIPRVLGLPSTSMDAIKPGDLSKPNPPFRASSSVSEEDEISYDGVTSQEQILMCSIPSDTAVPPTQGRDTRSSKASSKVNKTGLHPSTTMTSNPSLPQPPLKSSKGRKK